MRKQYLRGLGAASLVGALVVLSVPAEAAEIRCRIPFSFTVNGATLPPGSYTVSTQDFQMVVRGYGRGAFVLTNRLESSDHGSPSLVFHKYGEEYILRQAWMGSGSGRELPPPRLERELIRTARSGKVAVKFERVAVPAL